MAEDEMAAMDDVVIPDGKIDEGSQVVPQQPAEEAKEPDAAEMDESNAMAAYYSLKIDQQLKAVGFKCNHMFCSECMKEHLKSLVYE